MSTTSSNGGGKGGMNGLNGMGGMGGESKKRISVVSSENEPPPSGAAYRTPRVSILEASKEFLVKAEIPGAGTEDVDVKFEHGRLTLEARRRPFESERIPAVLRGRDLSNYRRTFTVGSGIDADHMRAVMGNDGMLHLHLPKREEHTVEITES